MTLTKRTQHKFFAALLASVLILLSPAHADDYRDARAELIAAYQQEDYPAMLIAANNALAARPGFPGAIFNLAMTQVLGDLIIADDNTIYTTDSLTGAIYRYYIDSNEFEILVQRGKLGSPQGLALDASGNYLYVADYIGGLYRVWLQDGSFVKLEIADDTTAYGIDGLYRYGNELVVIQNGIRPNRVAALQLSDNGLAITGSRLLAANLEQFDEPTLGVVRGDDFYFVANSHWNRFNRENLLPEGLTGPIILRLALD